MILAAAARGETPMFLADVTIRHPKNDNAELLWHCGPFPKSLAKDPKQRVMVDCHGQWELKGGDVTIARFDAIGGKYTLFAGEAKGTDGPGTHGNYLWIQTDNWPKWERKLVPVPIFIMSPESMGNISQFWMKLANTCVISETDFV